MKSIKENIATIQEFIDGEKMIRSRMKLNRYLLGGILCILTIMLLIHTQYAAAAYVALVCFVLIVISEEVGKSIIRDAFRELQQQFTNNEIEHAHTVLERWRRRFETTKVTQLHRKEVQSFLRTYFQFKALFDRMKQPTTA